jgi:DNA-binding CsgD family transcriptional regulator
MPAEEWRAELARAVVEATGAEFVTVATNQPGLWRIRYDVFPREHTRFVDRLDNDIRPHTEDTPDDWRRAVRQMGPVHAPLEHAHNKALADEAHRVLWDLTGSRGLICSFLVDARMRMFGVMALGARDGAPPLLDRELGSLQEIVRVATGTLAGAVDLARGCGLTLPGAPSGLEQLTPRERQIAELAAEGLSSLTIGARLGIREGTVSVHLHRIYAKLGVASRVQLALRLRG